MRRTTGTATSNFGVSRREGHDSSGFYARFRPPALSDDTTVLDPKPVDEPFVLGDARHMSTLADDSVALVVTSPPYFAGKQYEEELEREGVPSSYAEYLELLHDVFAECVRVLEPGGRIAVNVANLGRKPYRSLAADVIGILQDRLGLLLRGEIVWQKGEGASGSCAWGSFRSPSNPVLRDLTERVIVASKGRFDRAVPAKARAKAGLPHRSTILTEDFMSLTLDVWTIPAESATRVGHPAPFPVELPAQLIRLYTYEDDLVLDPFMGSGSSLVAAAQLHRRYVGYDLDPAYVDIARRRVADALDAPALDPSPAEVDGKAAMKLAVEVVTDAGFEITAMNRKVPKTGTAVSIIATDAKGAEWWFDVAGAFTTYRGGLQRTDVVWRSLGRAHALRGRRHADTPLVVLSSHLPRRSSEGDAALRSAGPDACFDVVAMLDPDDQRRLSLYAAGGHTRSPLPGFWSADDLSGR
ncbi:MAG: DNA-methyltransferase [Acidimicrobiales bacterium]